MHQGAMRDVLLYMQTGNGTQVASGLFSDAG